ncbi:MAG: methylmalonyl-CoA mutase family protein [Thermodesulfobacteriota bacterium]|nr:methylmalonyl-CoA mutase family protein [Thermodesulfobacteriota bacterium]
MEKRKQLIHPVSESEIKDCYTPEDIEGLEYAHMLGLPGEYPFTRGIYPKMYRKRLWSMRQYSGFGTAEETNTRWKALLASGQHGVSTATDLATQLGYDSDDPFVEDEVGRVGLAIDTLKDMEVLFHDIPLDRTPVSVNNAVSSAIVLMAMYIATAEKHGVPLDKLSGTTNNDVLSEYVGRGLWVFPPKPSLRLMADIVVFCIENMPAFYPLHIRGGLYNESGGTEAQEIGFGFADSIAYFEELIGRGLHIDQIGPRVTFFFKSTHRIFHEAAKFRAARRIWARLMQEQFGATNKNSLCLRVNTSVGGRKFASKEIELNLVRGAYGTLGAVLGGVQGMMVTGIDEAYAIPTEKTACQGLKVQQILAYETDVTETADPLGGSYFIEALTNQMEEEILKAMKEIEEQGGAVKAIEKGFTQKRVTERGYRLHREMETGQRVIVGVNKYCSEPETIEDREAALKLHKPNPESVRNQIERLKQVKAERDSREVQKQLERLRQAAIRTENLMPYVIDAVKAYASVGEIMGILKGVFGVFQEPVFI